MQNETNKGNNAIGNADAKTNNLHQTLGSGAKGSMTGVQIGAGGIDEMLNQLLQVLSQIKHSVDSDSPGSTIDIDGRLMGLANQLASNLQEQSSDAAEPTMQVVLQIIDTLADMLDSGQIALSSADIE